MRLLLKIKKIDGVGVKKKNGEYLALKILLSKEEMIGECPVLKIM